VLERIGHHTGRDLIIALAAVSAAVVVLLQVFGIDHPTTASLMLILVVLGSATLSRLPVAIATSIAAALALNYFFLPPLRTLSIADPDNWIALAVFVAVGAIASNLSSLAQKRGVAVATERLRAEREREAAVALQQRADLAATLLASISHDLRTPLTAIQVAVTNTQDPVLGADERGAQARLALRELDRLNRLFEDILDMARIDAAAVSAQREWVTPSDVVDAAVARVGSPLNGRPLAIDAASDVEAQVDPKLTSNALAHLIENAAQYSPAGTRIHITGWTSLEGLHLSVRDHGSGFDTSERDRLFERFYRGKDARRHSPGTGMGLAITRGLLAAEQGVVSAENLADGGAGFSILVPTRVRAVQEPVA
jgi:K+-sensing histidine kinase KdpD